MAPSEVMASRRGRASFRGSEISLTDCVLGSVPPFGKLWNIDVFIDESLTRIDEVVFSAGTLEDSIFLAPSVLVQINDAQIVDLLAE